MEQNNTGERAAELLATPLHPPARRHTSSSTPDAKEPILTKTHSINDRSKDKVDSEAPRTSLDSDDDDIPTANWSDMANSSVQALADDDKESTDSASSQTPPPAKVLLRKKRSPNRDDSDSEDENGAKLEKESKESDELIDLNHNPFVDPVALLNGFKSGFSEDRNKKYRRSMEDSHTISYSFNKIQGSGFFAIFDGHAGKTAADYCGANLQHHYCKFLENYPQSTIPEILNDTFVYTDTQLGERKLNSGCTAVVAHVQTEVRDQIPRRVLYIANVGDARAVLCRNGNAVRLSCDHKGSDPQETRRIVESGGFVMNNRVNGVLAVTRSLGDLSMKEFVIGNPYTTETILDKNDAFLILACDGIWDVCQDQDAVQMIKDIPDPQAAAEHLLDYALDNFSTDNLSVIVVRLDPHYLDKKAVL